MDPDAAAKLAEMDTLIKLQQGRLRALEKSIMVNETVPPTPATHVKAMRTGFYEQHDQVAGLTKILADGPVEVEPPYVPPVVSIVAATREVAEGNR